MSVFPRIRRYIKASDRGDIIAKNATSFFTTSNGLPIYETHTNGFKSLLAHTAQSSIDERTKETTERVMYSIFIYLEPLKYSAIKKNKSIAGKKGALSWILLPTFSEKSIDTPIINK